MEHLSFDRILELMTRNGYTCLDGNKIFISKDVLFFQLLKYIENIIFFVLLQTENGYVSPLT